MSKHLRRATRSRRVVLGAAAVAAASVATATVALGQGGRTGGESAAAATVSSTSTYACAGSAARVLHAEHSAAILGCTSGVSTVGRAATTALASAGTAGIPVPAGTTAGALLVTTVLAPAGSTVAVPGWTRAYDTASSRAGLRLSAWYRTAAAGDTAATATLAPAGRVSLVTSAFVGARDAAPVTSGTGPVGGGSRWLDAVGVRTRHAARQAGGRGGAGTTVVANGDTRLVASVASARPKAAVRRGAAVTGALAVLPRPAAPLPAGSIALPVDGRRSVDCGTGALSYRAVSPTAIAITCAGPVPTTSPTASPTSSATGSPTTSPTGSTTSSSSSTTSTTTTTTSTTTTTTTKPPAPSTTTTAPAPSGRACTSPVWRTSDPNGMWSEGGYVVHNNMWNVGGYSVSETLEACSHGSWNVTATADDAKGDGAVKTYPNVHKDYHDWGTGKEPAWSSFHSLTSTFAAQGSGTGIYDVAYDIWMNGVPGNREIMIWTENHGQRPSGSVVGTVTVSGIAWDVWATGGNAYLAFVPKAPVASGSLDLKAMIDYLVAQGRVPSSSTLGQICFGVEVVSTNGKPATFRFTDFSVASS